MDMPPRRTKIIATLGPASEDEGTIRRLADAGMDAVRLNFSHADHKYHIRLIQTVRRVSDRLGILQDLQGPRIRTGPLKREPAARPDNSSQPNRTPDSDPMRRAQTGPPPPPAEAACDELSRVEPRRPREGESGAVAHPVVLEAGNTITLTTRQVAGTAERVSVTYRGLPRDVRPGMTILISDGLLQLRVQAVRKDAIECRVVVGGELAGHQGVNVPEASLSISPFTEKDRRDLLLGLEQGVDFVALSFVSGPEDIRRVRETMREQGTEVPIIAKIERREAVENIEAILGEAEGVMVARGDLGIETSSADVPIIQKRLIALSNAHSAIDITATQMLQSMIRNPRPTRAEACDVANAVFDGTDALMLSAETAIGHYPVESVRTMAEIAGRAERELSEFGRPFPDTPAKGLTVPEATARAACLAAGTLQARAIVVFTESGRSAMITSQRRPKVPIAAFTTHQATLRRLSLAWGVTPFLCSPPRELDHAIDRIGERLMEAGFANRGDLVVVTAGTTMLPGATNMVRIVRLTEK